MEEVEGVDMIGTVAMTAGIRIIIMAASMDPMAGLAEGIGAVMTMEDMVGLEGEGEGDLESSITIAGVITTIVVEDHMDMDMARHMDREGMLVMDMDTGGLVRTMAAIMIIRIGRKGLPPEGIVEDMAVLEAAAQTVEDMAVDMITTGIGSGRCLR